MSPRFRARHILLPLALVSSWAARPAFAQSDSDSLISLSALERMKNALDAHLELGYGSFLDRTADAFYARSSGSTGEPATSVFEGGFPAVGVGVGFRFSKGFGLGLQAEWLSLSAASGASTPSFSASTYQLFTRVHFVNPEELANVWMDIAGGPGSFLRETSDSQLEITALVAGMKVGLDFRLLPMLPGLRVGPYGGVNFWIPTNRCTTAGSAAEQCGTDGVDTQVQLSYSLGLQLRFTLPVSTEPLPPPPPPPLKSEYVLVKSTLQVSTTEGGVPEVTGTAAHADALPSIRQVAVQAPSECVSQSAANATGEAAAKGTLVKTYCGVEMSEIERALTKQGFVVQSWNALEAMVRTKNLTPSLAAAQMGAQVLFQVNSLERIKAEPVRGAQWERRFYHSDAAGALGAPAELPEADRDALRGIVAIPETQALEGVRQGAMLDVNAILVSTGQTIWFYRWRKLDTGMLTAGVDAVAERVGLGPWKRIEPRRATESQPADSGLASVEAGQNRTGGGPESAQDALYFRLMREVVSDFVARFTQPAKK